MKKKILTLLLSATIMAMSVMSALAAEPVVDAKEDTKASLGSCQQEMTITMKGTINALNEGKNTYLFVACGGAAYETAAWPAFFAFVNPMGGLQFNLDNRMELRPGKVLPVGKPFELTISINETCMDIYVDGELVGGYDDGVDVLGNARPQSPNTAVVPAAGKTGLTDMVIGGCTQVLLAKSTGFLCEIEGTEDPNNADMTVESFKITSEFLTAEDVKFQYQMGGKEVESIDGNTAATKPVQTMDVDDGEDDDVKQTFTMVITIVAVVVVLGVASVIVITVLSKKKKQ